MLARRKMKLGQLSEAVGISIQNLSVLKTEKARAVRFSTLNARCGALDCQPGICPGPAGRVRGCPPGPGGSGRVPCGRRITVTLQGACATTWLDTDPR